MNVTYRAFLWKHSSFCYDELQMLNTSFLKILSLFLNRYIGHRFRMHTFSATIPDSLQTSVACKDNCVMKGKWDTLYRIYWVTLTVGWMARESYPLLCGSYGRPTIRLVAVCEGCRNWNILFANIWFDNLSGYVSKNLLLFMKNYTTLLKCLRNQVCQRPEYLLVAPTKCRLCLPAKCM